VIGWLSPITEEATTNQFLFFLDVVAEYIPKPQNKFNLKKIYWSKFNEFWEANNIYFFNSINFLNSYVCDKYSFLISLIYKSFEISLFKKKINKGIDQFIQEEKRIPARWWNEVNFIIKNIGIGENKAAVNQFEDSWRTEK